MIKTRIHKKHTQQKRAVPVHLADERINQLVQMEALELYERMGWVFGSNFREMLEEEMLI